MNDPAASGRGIKKLIKAVLRKRHKLGNRPDDFSVFNQFDLIRLQKDTGGQIGSRGSTKPGVMV